VTEEFPRPVDVALDLLVYVPVGLAMTAAKELPKLAEKGRARVTTQIAIARVVGELAVARGRQTLEKKLAPTPAPPHGGPSDQAATVFRPSTPPAGSQATVGADGPAVVPPEPGRGALEEEEDEEDLEDGAEAGPSFADETTPGVAELAIPGYDSLSASQVVQRLAGLSGPELTDVRTYEETHRGRRTILNRIDQLQGL
jgi:hypothetical protein